MTILTIEKYAELWVRLAAGAMIQMYAENEKAAIASAANVATSLMDELEAQLEKVDELVSDPSDPDNEYVTKELQCPKCETINTVLHRKDAEGAAVVCNGCSSVYSEKLK